MSSSAIRALRVLETVSRAARPLGVTEIARALSLNPGTVFRSLDALTRTDLVARYQSSSRYVLGASAERLRQSVIARFRMRELVLPYLRQLASVSGETTSLHVRLGWYGLRIASAAGTAEVTNAPALGEAHPLGDHYAGHAILAFLPDGEMVHYRVWAAKHGVIWLEKERALRSAREQGYALGETDFADQHVAVAFPIRTDGGAVAAVAIEGPVLKPASDADIAMPSEWREIMRHVESLARAQKDSFENPFAHLDPDSIAL